MAKREYPNRVEQAAYNGGIAAREKGVLLEFNPFRNRQSGFTSPTNMDRMKKAWDEGWEDKDREMPKEEAPQ